jgi:hypothetical protein
MGNRQSCVALPPVIETLCGDGWTELELKDRTELRDRTELKDVAVVEAYVFEEAAGNALGPGKAVAQDQRKPVQRLTNGVVQRREAELLTSRIRVVVVAVSLVPQTWDPSSGLAVVLL